MPNNPNRRAVASSPEMTFEQVYDLIRNEPVDEDTITLAMNVVQSGPTYYYGYGASSSNEGEAEPFPPDDEEEDDYFEEYDSEEEPHSTYDVAYNAFRELGLLREDFEMPRYKREHYNELRRSYNQNVEYRRGWIFDRIEREGFERRRLGKFSLDDLLERIGKRAEHKLNNETSKFYDWKLGGTEYIIRLEYIQRDGVHLLVCHYIYTPTDEIYRKDLRFWNGQKFELVDEQKVSYQY